MIVLRKIKNGMVTINKKQYKPVGVDYNDEFEGKTAAFGTYHSGFKSVCLWGTEEMFKAKTEDEYNRAWDNNWACINGVFKWEWWDEV